jgi:hypothetical protein
MAGEALKSLGELLEVLLPVFNLAVTGNQLQNDFDKVLPEVKNELLWTGDNGYLLYIPIGEHPGTHQLIYNGMRKMGPGPSDVEALALAQTQPTLDLPAPNFLSHEHSVYIWLDQATGRWGWIPPELTDHLRIEALTVKDDAALVSAIKDKRENSIFLHAVDVLRTKIQNDANAADILQHIERVHETHDKIESIKSALSDALEKDKRAGDFIQRIQLMRNVISVAQLIAEAQAAFPDANITQSENYVTLEQRMSEYKVRQGEYILRFRQQMSIQRELTNEEAQRLKPLLRDKGAPEELLRWSL